MHALLGLAASHLSLTSTSSESSLNLRTVALQHRLKAIRGTNEAISTISNSARTVADGDALLAACYALSFQASYMTDGLIDHFHMIRGCCLVAQQLRDEGLPLVFFENDGGRDHFDFMSERLIDLPVINPDLVNGADESLRVCAEELDLMAMPVNAVFWQVLRSLVDGVKVSSLVGM